MKAIQMILFMLAVTITLTLLLTNKNLNDSSSDLNKPPSPVQEKSPPQKRLISRFLQQNGRNPKAADQCKKDKEICAFILEGRNTTCCNNKCFDLGYDSNHCGACKKNCKATESCCNGKCVNLAYDKRHCGFCNNKCMANGLCIYGICDYA